jgi:hypothetical protein
VKNRVSRDFVRMQRKRQKFVKFVVIQMKGIESGGLCFNVSLV